MSRSFDGRRFATRRSFSWQAAGLVLATILLVSQANAQLPAPGAPHPPPAPSGTAPAGAPVPGAASPYPAPPPSAARPKAGGLTAPGALPSGHRAGKSATQKSLDEAAEKEGDRSLTWFWIDVEGGVQHVGLETFEVDTANLTAGFSSSTATGPYVGAGLGVQLVFLRLGPRFRIGFFDDWNMVSIGGELGLRFPLGPLEPHFELGAGYTALGSYADGLSVLPSDTSISGFNARVGGGLDFLLGSIFSLGVAASWEFMGLTRPGVALSDLDPAAVQSLDGAQQQALQAEGSAYGSAVTVGGRIGLNF